MSNLKFMIDIETTGIGNWEDLLQLCILPIKKGADGFWWPEHPFAMCWGTQKKPTSEFALRHMQPLYEYCSQFPVPTAEDFQRDRTTILTWLKETHGITSGEQVTFIGKCCSNFDLPFLVHKGLLLAPGKITGPDGKDQSVGDYHYRIDDLTPMISMAQDVLGISDRSAVDKVAFQIFPELKMLEVDPFTKKKAADHGAIYDCYKQLRQYNGLIRLLRGK